MKPKPWEIVRDKLLGIDIYGDEITLSIIFQYVHQIFEKTGENPDIIYVSKKGFEFLKENSIRPKGINIIRIYTLSGITEILPV